MTDKEEIKDGLVEEFYRRSYFETIPEPKKNSDQNNTTKTEKKMVSVNILMKREI